MIAMKAGRLAATVIMMGLFAIPGDARADAEEASIHAAVLMGGATDRDAVFPLPAAGMSGRFTYATNDWFAYEINMEFEHATAAAEMEPDPRTTWARRVFWLRGEAGVSVRLGVQWVPTIYIGVGAQARVAGQTRETIDGYTGKGPAPEVSFAPVGVAGIGLDYRLGPHWVAGLSVRARHGGPWESDVVRAAAVAVHLGYYWYPGNVR